MDNGGGGGDDEEEDSVYFVDEIIDKRYNLSSTEYLVKWTGWSSDHNTWEPDVNIIDTDLISAYEEKQRIKMVIADLKNDKKFATNKPSKDQWLMPWLCRDSSDDDELPEEPVFNKIIQVEKEEAIAVEEESENDVVAKVYEFKPRKTKLARKNKPVKSDNKSVNEITKKLKRSAAKTNVSVKKMKTGTAIPHS